LCGKLESDFVTAGYVYVDTAEGRIVYSSAGHMPLLLWRRSEQEIYELWEKGVILGQFEDAEFRNASMQIEPGDRFLVYTDGIVEASNPVGDLFGWERFKNFIKSSASLSANQFTDRLIQDLSIWSEKGSEASLDDDLTLVVVDVADADMGSSEQSCK
jgi:sigma-B regulation protein RsbU (phosphoserine phosphatase)